MQYWTSSPIKCVTTNIPWSKFIAENLPSHFRYIQHCVGLSLVSWWQFLPATAALEVQVSMCMCTYILAFSWWQLLHYHFSLKLKKWSEIWVWQIEGSEIFVDQCQCSQLSREEWEQCLVCYQHQYHCLPLIHNFLPQPTNDANHRASSLLTLPHTTSDLRTYNLTFMQIYLLFNFSQCRNCKNIKINCSF